jgi:hypothetical protein
MPTTAKQQQGLVIRETEGSKVLEVEASGKLTRADFERFIPEVERFIKSRGKIRVLLVMHQFHVWNLGALWEEAKFDMRHFDDFERIAMVGENKWQQWMSRACEPFTSAQIRYFHADEIETARTWLRGR